MTGRKVGARIVPEKSCMQKNSRYDNCTDETLIELSRGGDPAATEFLMEKYKGLVKSRARLFRLPDGDADDLIQEGMLGLFKALRDYDAGKEASFATFASLCISRQLRTAVEAAGRKKHQPLNTAVSYDTPMPEEGRDCARGAEAPGTGRENSYLELLASEDADPEAAYISEESRRHLEENIREVLSPLEREVLDLYLADLNYVQIAEKLGRDPKSTDNALQRIKTKVRKILRGE